MMSILNKKIIIFRRESNIQTAFLHFILSVLFTLAAAPLLTIIGLIAVPFGYSLFGFYFATLWQEMAHFLISLFIGVGLSSLYLAYKNKQNRKRVCAISVLLFTGMLVAYLIITIIGGGGELYYGKTNYDEFYEQVILFPIAIAEYFFVTKIIFKFVHKGQKRNMHSDR